ncbi:hypothetical protein BH10BAC6_BH10BAC6_12590 [soil metagenome]
MNPNSLTYMSPRFKRYMLVTFGLGTLTMIGFSFYITWFRYNRLIRASFDVRIERVIGREGGRYSIDTTLHESNSLYEEISFVPEDNKQFDEMPEMKPGMHIKKNAGSDTLYVLDSLHNHLWWTRFKKHIW